MAKLANLKTITNTVYDGAKAALKPFCRRRPDASQMLEASAGKAKSQPPAGRVLTRTEKAYAAMYAASVVHSATSSGDKHVALVKPLHNQVDSVLEAAPNLHAEDANVTAFGPPEIFLCPITQELMRDPVVATDGHTYERHAIERWIARRQASPLTNTALELAMVLPNHAIRQQIVQWRETHATASLVT